MRRNLSGIYIFDQLKGDTKSKPTCFEDCQPETQEKWLDTLDERALKNLAMMLGRKLREIGDALDITTNDEA